MDTCRSSRRTSRLFQLFTPCCLRWNAFSAWVLRFAGFGPTASSTRSHARTRQQDGRTRRSYAQHGFGTQRRPNLAHSMVLGPEGAQTLRTVWFGDPEEPKPYAQYGFGTQRRPNLTHSMVWGPRGAQTLRTVWFGDPGAPKPYAHYGLETQRRAELS